MAGEPTITIIGTVASEPDLKYLASGAAVTNFSVASTPRSLDKASNEWKDGETMWVRCAVWRDAAENVAESLVKGTRVIVQGRLKVRSYEKDGVTRTNIEMDVDEVGPTLRWATAKVTKAARSGNSSAGGYTPKTSRSSVPSQVADPWATTTEAPF